MEGLALKSCSIPGKSAPARSFDPSYQHHGAITQSSTDRLISFSSVHPQSQKSGASLRALRDERIFPFTDNFHGNL
jgi:hypothetical protein